MELKIQPELLVRRLHLSTLPMGSHYFRRVAASLLRAPSLSVISILTVALGVGAGTALFSVVKAVLLNPLPYPEAGRLAWVAEVNEGGRPMQVAQANFKDWQRENRSFAGLAAYG